VSKKCWRGTAQKGSEDEGQIEILVEFSLLGTPTTAATTTSIATICSQITNY
jgi:hypothetical protein